MPEPRRPKKQKKDRLSRRDFLALSAGAGAVLTGLALGSGRFEADEEKTSVFIGRAEDYSADLGGLISRGLKELGIGPDRIRGKRVLLKPNMVEAHYEAAHICTNPAVVMAAAETFFRLGAARVIIGEGAGHCTDPYRTLDISGLGEVINPTLPFVDLNNDELITRPNRGSFTRLKHLTLPREVVKADLVVSLAKMKTHHWTGVTLSMKNMFGIMPGRVYGWPKNVLHQAGVVRSILDINATCPPHLAIVDGVVGMEGDGPLMGPAKKAGVLVMGLNPTAVDSTATRIMGLDPLKVDYLRLAAGRLGTVTEDRISQRGETIAQTRTPFALCAHIPAHRKLMGRAAETREKAGHA